MDLYMVESVVRESCWKLAVCSQSFDPCVSCCSTKFHLVVRRYCAPNEYSLRCNSCLFSTSILTAHVVDLMWHHIVPVEVVNVLDAVKPGMYSEGFAERYCLHVEQPNRHVHLGIMSVVASYRSQYAPEAWKRPNRC
ncbi:hypothetical protein Q31a_30980 [Aureliella helgolandensis]|uniref:Uncharacterized protein n=1 Tax=Aureliella helgolandensis TaxID=2527968 RepID=A0A518G868_9BACT|nr:hypothetical protein Q31a_30980 [Aureliella helgolandensis]